MHQLDDKVTLSDLSSNFNFLLGSCETIFFIYFYLTHFGELRTVFDELGLLEQLFNARHFAFLNITSRYRAISIEVDENV